MIIIYAADYTLKETEKKYEIEHQKGLSLLRHGLKEVYNLAINDTELLNNIKHGEHDKPYLDGYPDIHFNISHCDNTVVCAISDKPIGIDAECITKFKDSLMKKVLTEDEVQFLKKYEEDKDIYQEMFYRFWTLKESYLKWDGSGFFKEPKSVSFQLYFEKGYDNPQIRCSDGKVDFGQIRLKENVILSVCKERMHGQEMDVRWL